MATIDLGKIKQVFRGTYNNSTAYAVDDLVVFTDGTVTSTYICTTASTGNNPSSGGTAHASWAYVAKGQAVSPTTTQGDIIVRGASADARLAIGTAGQSLKVNSSANGLEYGSGSLVERVYHWVDDTQVVPPNTTSGSSTGSNVFTYTIQAKTANPIYRLDWSFFWGLNDTNGDSNEIMAIAGVFTHASNTGLSNLAYGFGYKGGSRANATFRGQTGTYVLFDSDAGAPGTSGHWSGAMQNVMAFGNTAAVDTGTIGKCGDDSTQTVSAGQTLYLRGWVGNGNMGSYGRTENQTNHMTKAQVILTEFNSSGQ